jgi:DNA-binding CsgD family transcriptional regulator
VDAGHRLTVMQGQSNFIKADPSILNGETTAQNQKTQEEAARRLAKLTDKQHEVLSLVVQRKTSKQIARILGISKPAVDQRIASARDTLGVASRDDAALLFMQTTTAYDRVIYDPVQLSKGTITSPQKGWEQFEDNPVHMTANAGLRRELIDADPFATGGIRQLLLDKLSGENRVALRSILIMVLSVCMMALVLIGLSVSEVLSRLIASS